MSRIAVLVAVAAVLMLPAATSAAAPAERYCGVIHASDGARIGVMVLRGQPKCRTARRVLRAYIRSTAPCEGSACVRRHHGWTCASATWYDAPRLASCERGTKLIAAYSSAD